MAVVCVDSNIWYVAYTKPSDPAFDAVHRRCRAFLDTVLSDPSAFIAISTYQMAEIAELLRRGRVADDVRPKLLAAFETAKFIPQEVTRSIVREAMRLSGESGIHVYDYLVALPLRGVVDRLYSADDHFLHPHFTSIAPVENPVAPWRLQEGRKPTGA